MYRILIAILLSTSLFAGLNIVSQDNITGVQEEIQLYDKTYALVTATTVMVATTVWVNTVTFGSLLSTLVTVPGAGC